MTFPLTPQIHEEVARFVSDTQRLHLLTQEYGSPLNILFPQLVEPNIHSFQTVLEDLMDRSQIYYAHKPNKSAALLGPIEASGAGVDVASLTELRNALASNIDPQRIEATGPKNDQFIHESVKAGIIVNIDSLTELELVARESAQQQVRTRIFVRLSGFVSEHTQVRWNESRFGVLTKDIQTVIDLCLAHAEHLQFEGVSFHVNAGGDKERIVAIESAIACFLQARKAGLSPQVMNIGGGFPINYLSRADEWHAYVSALKQSVLGHGERLSWNDSGLGFVNRDGVLAGGAQFAEFFRDRVKGDSLSDLLHMPLPTYNQPVYQVLNDMLIGLAIEPGRALLDQVGITVARVLDVKETSSADQVVIVDLNRSNINAIDLELMMDPLLIAQHPTAQEPFGAFIAGNLCLHSDLLYRHKTFFPHRPVRGDLLVFVNTAAYSMNFAESRTLGQPLATTLLVKDNAVCATDTSQN